MRTTANFGGTPLRLVSPLPVRPQRSIQALRLSLKASLPDHRPDSLLFDARLLDHLPPGASLVFSHRFAPNRSINVENCQRYAFDCELHGVPLGEDRSADSWIDLLSSAMPAFSFAPAPALALAEKPAWSALVTPAPQRLLLQRMAGAQRASHAPAPLRNVAAPQAMPTEGLQTLGTLLELLRHSLSISIRLSRQRLSVPQIEQRYSLLQLLRAGQVTCLRPHAPEHVACSDADLRARLVDSLESWVKEPWGHQVTMVLASDQAPNPLVMDRILGAVFGPLPLRIRLQRRTDRMDPVLLHRSQGLPALVPSLGLLREARVPEYHPAPDLLPLAPGPVIGHAGHGSAR